MTLNTPLCGLYDPERIALDVVNGVTVSTVKLRRDEDVWETCVFFALAHSEVVGKYTTQEDAVLGHVEWVDHYSKENN